MESIDTVALASHVVTDTIGAAAQSASRVDTGRVRWWWWQSDWARHRAVRQRVVTDSLWHARTKDAHWRVARIRLVAHSRHADAATSVVVHRWNTDWRLARWRSTVEWDWQTRVALALLHDHDLLAQVRVQRTIRQLRVTTGAESTGSRSSSARLDWVRLDAGQRDNLLQLRQEGGPIRRREHVVRIARNDGKGLRVDSWADSNGKDRHTRHHLHHLRLRVVDVGKAAKRRISLPQAIVAVRADSRNQSRGDWVAVSAAQRVSSRIPGRVQRVGITISNHNDDLRGLSALSVVGSVGKQLSSAIQTAGSTGSENTTQ